MLGNHMWSLALCCRSSVREIVPLSGSAVRATRLGRLVGDFVFLPCFGRHFCGRCHRFGCFVRRRRSHDVLTNRDVFRRDSIKSRVVTQMTNVRGRLTFESWKAGLAGQQRARLKVPSQTSNPYPQPDTGGTETGRQLNAVVWIWQSWIL